MTYLTTNASPRRRSGRNRVPAARLAALLIAAAAPAVPALEAAPAGELDQLVQRTLDEIPAEHAADAVSWLLEASEGTTGFHSVSPAGLFQDVSPDGEFLFLTDSGSIRSFGPELIPCGYAPVHLPQGATLTVLVLWVRDANPSADTTVELRRKANGSTANSTSMASATSSGSATGSRIFTDFTVTDPVVDNVNYSYFVSICLASFYLWPDPTELRGIYLGYTF